MRRLLATTVLLCGLLATQVVAQTRPPFRIGTHVAGNLMNGPFDYVRAGGQLLIPLSARLYAYPAVSRFFDGTEGKWQMSAALRYRPFGATETTSPFYVGIGWTGISWGPNHEEPSASYDVWLTGVEIPVGRVRPFVEMQVLGPIKHAGTSIVVQAYSGLTWELR